MPSKEDKSIAVTSAELIPNVPSEPLQHIRLGRPPRFKEPKELLLCLYDYAEWCSNNPIRVQQLTKDGVEYVEKQRPLTLDGLCLWCNILAPWATFKYDYTKKRADGEAFSIVISACEAAIRNQQVTGAMIGIFSERLVARLNGIADKLDMTAKVETKPAMTYEQFCEQCRIEEESNA